jgi:hypothetical protein
MELDIALDVQQGGFRKNRGTLDQAIVLDEWLKYMKPRKQKIIKKKYHRNYNALHMVYIKSMYEMELTGKSYGTFSYSIIILKKYCRLVKISI